MTAPDHEQAERIAKAVTGGGDHTGFDFQLSVAYLDLAGRLAEAQAAFAQVEAAAIRAQAQLAEAQKDAESLDRLLESLRLEWETEREELRAQLAGGAER